MDNKLRKVLDDAMIMAMKQGNIDNICKIEQTLILYNIAEFLERIANKKLSLRLEGRKNLFE